VTRDAAVVALAGLACLVAGIGLHYWEVVALGLALVLTLAAAAGFVVRMPRLAVTRRPVAGRGCEGEAGLVVVTVENRGRRRRAGFVAFDGPAHRPVALAVPALAAGARHTVTGPRPALRRGRYELGPLHVVRSDPLGLLVRRRRYGESQPLWVHPRTDGAAGAAGATPRAGRRRAAPGGAEPEGVRRHRPGDDDRRVHWPSSVRRDDQLGHLLVRDARPGEATVVVVLDTAASSYPPDGDGDGDDGGGDYDVEAFDGAVRRAATTLADALRSGRRAELRTTGGLVVAAGPGRRPPVEVLDRMAEIVPDGAGGIARRGAAGGRSGRGRQGGAVARAPAQRSEGPT
jgi:uncharacterized protein (DUF58 family)